jgi:ABC-type amino acid transport substrate-binding protein
MLLCLSVAGCGGGNGGGSGGSHGAHDGSDPFATMKKNKFVRIATDAVNLPFEFGSGTGVQGFDVDLGAEIAKDLGYDPKWIKMNFEKLFDLVQRGEVEMAISAISITPERQKDFLFSDPYFEAGNTIARRRDKPQIKDLASLSGKRVGVQSSATGQLFMESQKAASNVTLRKFPTLDDALGALNRTELDAVVGDEPILTYSIFKSFQNLMTTGAKVTTEHYGVLMRKGDTELAAKVNATIARLRKAGAIEKLRVQWFQNVMQETKSERNKMEEDERLKKAPKSVSVGIAKSGGTFRMDRLDGHVVKLSGPGGNFTSSPINTNGNNGHASFPAAIPPGSYQLNFPVLKLNTTVTVPETATKSMRLSMSIGNTVSISLQ